MSEEQVSDFLEHYGVQGMKWGQRRAANKANVSRLQGQGLTKRQAKATNRAQNRVDKVRMAATGRQGKVSVLKQLNNRAFASQHLGLRAMLKHPLSVKKASAYQLERAKDMQSKINNGEKKVTAALLKLSGISIKDINYAT